MNNYKNLTEMVEKMNDYPHLQEITELKNYDDLVDISKFYGFVFGFDPEIIVYDSRTQKLMTRDDALKKYGVNAS